MPQHSPWIMQHATHSIVDALLSLIVRQGLWPCHDLCCSWRRQICWFWVFAVTAPWDYTICNTQNHWHSFDTLLMLCWCSFDALLMLCWRSFWGVAVSINTILPINDANTSIMSRCRSTAHELYKMQHTKSLTLCWRSFSDWGCDHVMITFAHNGCQYVDSGYMP
jgi:hypothetical protein